MTDFSTLERPDALPVGWTPFPAIRLSIQTAEFGDGVVIVAARGEVDLATAPLLGEALELVIRDPATRMLVCDLSEVCFLSCAGMTVLVNARVRLAGRGGVLRVVTRHPAVLRVLAITGLHDSLGVCADRMAALAGDQPLSRPEE